MYNKGSFVKTFRSVDIPALQCKKKTVQLGLISNSIEFDGIKRRACSACEFSIGFIMWMFLFRVLLKSAFLRKNEEDIHLL